MADGVSTGYGGASRSRETAASRNLSARNGYRLFVSIPENANPL